MFVRFALVLVASFVGFSRPGFAAVPKAPGMKIESLADVRAQIGTGFGTYYVLATLYPQEGGTEAEALIAMFMKNKRIEHGLMVIEGQNYYIVRQNQNFVGIGQEERVVPFGNPESGFTVAVRTPPRYSAGQAAAS